MKTRLSFNVLVLVSLPFFLTGCNQIGFVWQAIDPPRADKTFKLIDRPTLILVDDPANELGSPQLATVAAVSASTDLKTHGVVRQLIDQNKVFDLAAKNPTGFEKMGVANVGRAVGAMQVVHVHILSATYLAEPGMLRPSANVLVKVIDTSDPARSKKIFPPPPEAAAGLPVRDGAFILKVSMRHKVTGDDTRRQMTLVRQKLADKIGVQVAKLFYKYEIRKPGAIHED